ncbi:MAG: outer membrane beta-barrel protein [Alphaproteobacteria bacterium]|nr:outer membrane beta-barrel protein [Alphaproteobacteria bacterium]
MAGAGKWAALVAAGAMAGLAAFSGPALAQLPSQTQSTPPANGSALTQEDVRTFDPAFFDRYTPVTAYDMARQLPGFIIDDGLSLRGFGATAGNVLIDGQRPSSKTSVSDELKRISAGDVARIELIGAAAAGNIDVRGYTEIANVVLKPATGVKASSTYSGLVGFQDQGHASGRAGITRSWKGDDFGLRLNAQVTDSQQHQQTVISFSDVGGAATGSRDEFTTSYLGELLLNGTFNWSPTARDAISITSRVMPRSYNLQSGATVRATSGEPTEYVADDYTEKDIIYLDLGGDWEHRFSPTNSVKLTSVNSFVGWRPQEFYQDYPASGPRDLATRINADNKKGEHVLRAVWTTKPGASHTLELGLEGAFNYRDTDLSIANAKDAEDFMPAALPVASTRVEETRGEASINDTWLLDPRLTLELGFTYEASKISQSGDAVQSREFRYPKPRFVATWLPTKRDQFRLSVERTLAQLDFSEFASVVQLVENQLTVGNPDLKPEQTWASSLQWKRPIGKRGSISLTGSYDRINDVEDLVVLQNGDTQFTGAGNIGDGERWGAELNLQLPLDSIGVKGGMLKFIGSASDSRVTDPISHESRRITNDLNYQWNLDFRQDLPGLKMAWGGDYNDLGDYEAYRLTEVQRLSWGPGDFDLFVETTRVKGMTITLAVENIFNQPRNFARRFYKPSRIPPGAFSGSEFRESTTGYLTTLRVSGKF